MTTTPTASLDATDRETAALAGLRVPAPASVRPNVLVEIGLADRYGPIDSPLGRLVVAWNGLGVVSVDVAGDDGAFEASHLASTGRRAIPSDVPPRLANAIARRSVVPPHRDGGQAQYVEAPVPEPTGDTLTATLEWAMQHLDEPLTIAELAEHARMSPRTFARRFRETTGDTPHQWLLRQRVLRAQALLETTDEPVERVAQATGFGAASALRVHFQRQLGTSPQAYRRTFRQRDELELAHR